MDQSRWAEIICWHDGWGQMASSWWCHHQSQLEVWFTL